MQEINTNQNLILLAQLTSSKNGNRTFLKREIKQKEKDLQSANLSYRNMFFSVIMYCTIQYRMLPYT